ncbi:MAG: ABC transporter permease subunit [Candidatus Wallbacteria bacterium]|nr:ABC transporter permease subunit [Candidatus Wallbacteria bacterium]
MIIGKSFKSRRICIILGVFSILVLITAYSFLSTMQHRKNINDTTIPGLKQLIEGYHKVVTPTARGDVWLYEDLSATLSRLFSGLFISILISLCLAVGMGCFPTIEALLTPVVSILAKLTPTAMLAVFFVIFGTGTQMFVSMIVFGIVPSLTQSTYLAVKKIPREFIDKAYTLGGSTFEVIWFVIVKQIFPVFLNNIRLSIGPAMVYLIAAEMLVGDVGFGYRIRIQSRLLAMNVVYLYLAVLAAFGYLMDYSLSRINQKLFSWFNQE